MTATRAGPIDRYRAAMRVGLDPCSPRPATDGPARPVAGRRRPDLRARGARRTTAVALVAVAALGLTACGGGEGDDEATVAPDASAGAPATTAATPATGDGEEAKAGAVVAQYIAAFSAGDGDAVCRLYTPAQRGRISDASDGSCAAGIRKAFAQGGAEEGFKQSLGNLRVGSTTVTGRRAVVKLVALQGGGNAAPLEVELQRSGGTWRISRPGG